MYSHGLEKIYAFETINPKSVKAVAVQKRQETTVESSSEAAKPEQLLLALGPAYSEGLPTFRLKEPISSLGLSAFAAKVLLSKEICTVDDAYRFIRSNADKGLGQSHIEEIEAKLNAFVGKNPYCLQKTIDWQSIVRTACKDLGAKERYFLLARFLLEDLAPITTQELQELERIKPKTPVVPDLAFIDASLQAIGQAYLLPWLTNRHGISIETELQERLEAISLSHFRPTFAFFSAHTKPIKLHEVERGVYACDRGTSEEYKTVLECAKGYFYKPHATYPLTTLVRLVTNELAKKGIGFSLGFIEKALTVSPSFIISSSQTILKNMTFLK